MGRSKKCTVDYFPHFVSTDSRTKFILEQSWGNDGYAFWFKLLELLGRSERHYYDLTIQANEKYLLALMKLDRDTVYNILSTLADLESIDKELWEERKVVWCQNFVDNLDVFYSKRTDPAPTRPFTETQPEEPLEQEESAKEQSDPGKGRSVPRGIYEEIVALYNEICVSFPRLRSLSDARRKAIKARLTNGYTVDSFRELFQKAEASSFLKGKNDRNWRATFDWLIKDSNMAKVIDGNYDNKGGNNYGAGTNRGGTGGQPADPGAFKPSGGFKGQ